MNITTPPRWHPPYGHFMHRSLLLTSNATISLPHFPASRSLSFAATPPPNPTIIDMDFNLYSLGRVILSLCSILVPITISNSTHPFRTQHCFSLSLFENDYNQEIKLYPSEGERLTKTEWRRGEREREKGLRLQMRWLDMVHVTWWDGFSSATSSLNGGKLTVGTKMKKYNFIRTKTHTQNL